MQRCRPLPCRLVHLLSTLVSGGTGRSGAVNLGRFDRSRGATGASKVIEIGAAEGVRWRGGALRFRFRSTEDLRRRAKR